jgi:hypothetical protein
MISFGSIQNLRATTLNYIVIQQNSLILARGTHLLYIGKAYDELNKQKVTPKKTKGFQPLIIMMVD